MIEILIAAVMCCAVFFAPAMFETYGGQPRLLASLLALGMLVGLAVVGWLVAAYWMRTRPLRGG
jgi:hypothetical protein